MEIPLKTLVVAPLGLELKLLIEAFREKDIEITQDEAQGVAFYSIPSLGLALARGGHGKVQCALKAQQVIMALPRLQNVICAGAAGRLHPDLQVGDLILCEKTIEHDYHERMTKNPPPEFPAGELLLKEFAWLKTKNLGFATHFAPMASGDEDIMDRQRAAEIAERTGAWAVAWEGAGVARAADLHGKEFLEIRGITDGADADALLHFQQNLRLVMARIAQILMLSNG